MVFDSFRSITPAQ